MATEKIFMKIWNRFIRKHTTIPDRDLPVKCMEFITAHGHSLMDLNLRQNLILHLFNLWDSRILSASHIISCISAYDSLSKARPPLQLIRKDLKRRQVDTADLMPVSMKK